MRLPFVSGSSSNARIAKRFLLTLSVVVFGAFYPLKARSYLAPPLTVNPGLLAGAQPVLIYYSNATAPDAREQEDYRKIISWLYDSGEASLIEIAQQFELDLTHFPLMVGRDLEAIENSPKSATGALAGIVVATNPLARDGKIEMWKYPAQSFERVKLRIEPPSNVIDRSNPLATRAGLEAVLNWTSERFDPKKYSFVLFTKSHGTEDLLFTPRLVTTADLGKDSILSIARGETSLGYKRPGISKSEFLRLIQNFGEKVGMKFSLIFLESCDSGSQLLGQGNLPSNIGAIIATDDTGAQAYTLSYVTLFRRLYSESRGQPATTIIWNYLNERVNTINPAPTYRRIKFHATHFLQARGIYFLPLIVVAFFWFKSRKLTRHQNLG